MDFETRERLVGSYIDVILDNLSTSDLIEMVGGYLEEQFASYRDEQLIEEVGEYYPELLEV
jgi:hypothetical protein